jgi:hypothetical protein
MSMQRDGTSPGDGALVAAHSAAQVLVKLSTMVQKACGNQLPVGPICGTTENLKDVVN